MILVGRDQWGARGPRGSSRLRATDVTAGHWNGPAITIGGQGVFGHDRCASLVRGIQSFHMNARGWFDIAYNFVVCQHGAVYVGRGINTRSAANGTNASNGASHAVMYLGGEGNEFTQAGRSGMKAAFDYIAKSTTAPAGGKGHRDIKATACPGDTIYHWIRSGMPLDGSTPPPPPPTPKPTPQPPSSSKGVNRVSVSVKMPVIGNGDGFKADPHRAVHKPHVAMAQATMVHKSGQKIDIDGLFGAATVAATKNVQKFFGLTVDGIIGKNTWEVLLAFP